jgi:hypothetical protein
MRRERMLNFRKLEFHDGIEYFRVSSLGVCVNEETPPKFHTSLFGIELLTGIPGFTSSQLFDGKDTSTGKRYYSN